MIGSGLAIGSSTKGLKNPGAGNIISSSTALLTSVAILITNEYIPELKKRYTKLRDWINVIPLLYEKTSKTSMVDKKTNEKEIEELKNIYNKKKNGTRRAQIPRKPLIFPSPNKQTNRQTKNFGHTEVRTLEPSVFSTILLPTEL